MKVVQGSKARKLFLTSLNSNPEAAETQYLDVPDMLIRVNSSRIKLHVLGIS